MDSLFIVSLFLIFINCDTTNGAWLLQFSGTSDCRDPDRIFAMKFSDKCVRYAAGSSFQYQCSKYPMNNLTQLTFNKDYCQGDADIKNFATTYDCVEDPGSGFHRYSHKYVCLDDYNPGTRSNLHFEIPLYTYQKDVGSKDNPIQFDYYIPIGKCFGKENEQHFTTVCDPSTSRAKLEIFNKGISCVVGPQHVFDLVIGDVIDLGIIENSGKEHLYWKYVGCFDTKED